MVWNRSKQSVILVGLAVLAAALGLHSMSAGAAPPQQEPYPPPCPCTLVLVTAGGSPSNGSCVPVTCRVTDGAGLPAAGVECTLSILSQPGTGATLTSESPTSDDKGEAKAELCVGSTAGEIVVKGDTGCCEGQVKLTVPPGETPTSTPTPRIPPATGSGTSGGNSRLTPLIAIGGAVVLAAGAILVWRTAVGRRQSS